MQSVVPLKYAPLPLHSQVATHSKAVCRILSLLKLMKILRLPSRAWEESRSRTQPPRGKDRSKRLSGPTARPARQACSRTAPYWPAKAQCHNNSMNLDASTFSQSTVSY